MPPRRAGRIREHRRNRRSFRENDEVDGSEQSGKKKTQIPTSELFHASSGSSFFASRARAEFRLFCKYRYLRSGRKAQKVTVLIQSF